jgi:hypothetical protein
LDGKYGVYLEICRAWNKYSRKVNITNADVWLLLEDMARVMCLKCRLLVRTKHNHARLIKEMYDNSREDILRANLEDIDAFVEEKIDTEKVSGSFYLGRFHVHPTLYAITNAYCCIRCCIIAQF